MVDYLLVVGPGRSGSDFLYRILRAHPGYAFPEIKEGGYYRSVRAYQQARADVRQTGTILCDISNNAYLDPKLLPGVQALRQQGVSILLVVLLRNHRERAVSSIRFRRSRGRPSALLGARHLEKAVVRDRLTAELLHGIFALDVDILTLDFTTLVEDTERCLASLASLCGSSSFGAVANEPVNVSTQARFVWFSTIGWLGAVALRRVGLTRQLQRVKDSRLVGRMFFKPLAPDGEKIRLSDGAVRTLDATHRECWSIVTRLSTREYEGVFVRRAPTNHR